MKLLPFIGSLLLVSPAAAQMQQVAIPHLRGRLCLEAVRKNTAPPRCCALPCSQQGAPFSHSRAPHHLLPVWLGQLAGASAPASFGGHA